MPPAELTAFIAGVRRGLGIRATAVGQESTDEIIGLLLAAWPIKALAGESPLHRSVRDAGVVARARVRERWEARHGEDERWWGIMSPMLGYAWIAILRHWFSGEDGRRQIVSLSAAAMDDLW